ncbi:lysosome-associated membrane glycoprotein 2 isoform X2 [Anoplopoma fimbria]|uniref:lysosome-associated membrane glycoprotein 2 isoform X2 n=1 Tax=Anoplopoma fimbria TaxID=229290 RepID=UPI0023ECB002|nr:lysosome-associated membrane glycoprotein 2 isoform X2 [Anoplopoma fimbria]
MYRYASFVLSLGFALAFQLSHGTEVTVKDKDNKICLYANLMVNFSVSYKLADDKSATAQIELPVEVTTDGSTCDKTSSMLKLNFGEGHSWSVNFAINGKVYQADTITFSYNLSDKTKFPNSASNGTVTVSVKPHVGDVGLDTCYSCKSKETIEAESVNQTLWDVHIQAFVSDNIISENITSCAADVPSTPAVPTIHATTTTPVAPTTISTTTTSTTTTPAAPTTTSTTTTSTTTTPAAPTTTSTTTTSTTTTPAAPTTNSTTTTPAAPTTNSTTPTAPTTNSTTIAPPPTTTPTPTLPTPTIGEYSVKSGVNGTVCLMANFGLRIGVKNVEMNLEPNGTTSSGTCEVNSSQLVLTSNAMIITLTFANDTKKFRLHALNVTGKTSSGVAFSEVNTNLSLWEAAVGSSYMCNKEQNYTITSQLTIFTFNLHVQPFGVKKGVFSTAHECSLDDTSILIPIIVGAALAGLILIVVIAYVIGRRKTYVGYQTL